MDAAVISILVTEEHVEPSAADPLEGVDGVDGVDEASPEAAADESEVAAVEPAPIGVDEALPAPPGDESEPESEAAAWEAEPIAGVDEELPAPSGEESGPELEAAAWEPAPIAGRYRIGEYLATSRLGRTYRATDTETGEDVEVTFLQADAVAAAAGVEGRLEELRALTHVHTLALLDWEIAPVPYLVHAAPEMRLDSLIAAGAALSPSQTLLIGLQAAETLHSLRGRGVTHGALTSWHCCVDASGRLRLAEMGLDFLRSPQEPAPAAPAQPDPLAPPADGDPSPLPDEPPPTDPAAADVHGLGLALTEAALGRPVAPAEIGGLGQAVLPRGAGSATARHLARLAPLLVQATAASPEQRLEADEMALALRATAEMLPPPSPLDEVFGRLGDGPGEDLEGDPVEQPGAGDEPEAVPQPRPGSRRNPLMRLVAAAAVVAAGALLVVSVGGGDDTTSHTVPDVVGATWNRARDTLTASGWEVRRLEVRVPDAAADEVVGQLPEAGGLLDEGQVVKVQVSLGPPLVVIPADIVGMTVGEAGLRLSAVGLVLGAVETRADDTVPEGSVLAVAELLPELPLGSTVDLVIAGDG